MHVQRMNAHVTAGWMLSIGALACMAGMPPAAGPAFAALALTPAIVMMLRARLHPAAGTSARVQQGLQPRRGGFTREARR